jgi:putative membrane protein
VRALALGLISLVAALHLYFLWLEMFRWTAPRTRRAFGTSEAFARETRVLAANQGLYNGFLAAGLLWALGAYGLEAGRPILSFFLACVAVAGVYGAATANKRILFIQALPALLALGCLWSL